MADDIILDVPDIKVVIDKPEHYHVVLQNEVHKTILQNPENYLISLSRPGTTAIGLPLSAVFAISSSYSITSSYAENAGASFPYTGSAQITGSVGITGSFSVGTGSNCILTVNPVGRVGINMCNPQYALHVSGAIFATDDVTAFSDRRVKTNIQPIWFAMSKIERLQGVTYTRIDQVDQKVHMGFIAQDVKNVIPEVVVGNEEQGYGISYGNITALLVEAVKELKDEIDEIRLQL